MANQYEVGDVVRLSTTTVFTDIEGAPFDPVTVVFKVKPPSGVTVTLTYPDDDPATITKDGTGDYHTDVDLTAAGWWYYRVEGKDASDDPLGADEGYLEVSGSNV